MKNMGVNNISLAYAGGLVLFAIAISCKHRLEIEKDILVSVFRAIIQLGAVGFFLKYIFQVDNAWLTALMILVIIYNASRNAAKKSGVIDNALWASFTAVFVSTVVTLTGLVFSGAVKFIPSQMIPISGMIAGNAMVATGLCFRSLNTLFKDQRQQILEKLSLGASPALASKTIIRTAIKMGMQPTIDSVKTYGIVSLPGMMSGLIFAGVDPLYAIKYQIMVAFMLLSATSLASVMAVYLVCPKFYTDRAQLRAYKKENHKK